VIDFWVDDLLILGADHTDEPIEQGGFGFIISDTDAEISFDNFVVCGLNEPYQPAVEGQ
jgi:hypothetical protein